MGNSHSPPAKKQLHWRRESGGKLKGSCVWRIFCLEAFPAQLWGLWARSSRRVQFPWQCFRTGHIMFHGLAWLQASSSVKPDPACDIVKNRMHNCNCLKLSLVSCLDVWAVCSEMCAAISMLFVPFWNAPETFLLTRWLPSCSYVHHTWIKDHEKLMFDLRGNLFLKIHHTALMNLEWFHLNVKSGSLVLD